MPDHGIPEAVKQFIFEHLDSVEQLETLLLLRSRSEKSWSAREVSDELRTNPASAAKRLATLAAIGLLDQKADSPEVYHYAPKSEAQAAMVAGLAEAYRVRRHLILELMFSPMKRARRFADAFVVRGHGKDGKDDG